MTKRALSVLLGLLVVGQAAMAQGIVLPSVLSFNDKVLVNRGGQYQPFTPETALQAGDKLMVLDGGEVTLGCPGEPLVTFKTTGAYDLPDCNQAVASTSEPTPATEPVAPVPVTEGATAATGGATAGGLSGKTIALGAAAAAVVIGVAAASGGGDDGGSNPPVSP